MPTYAQVALITPAVKHDDGSNGSTTLWTIASSRLVPSRMRTHALTDALTDALMYADECKLVQQERSMPLSLSSVRC